MYYCIHGLRATLYLHIHFNTVHGDVAFDPYHKSPPPIDALHFDQVGSIGSNRNFSVSALCLQCAEYHSAGVLCRSMYNS